MKQAPSVKKSISLPAEDWEFVEQHSIRSGHGMASRVIQQAVREMQKNIKRRKGAK